MIVVAHVKKDYCQIFSLPSILPICLYNRLDSFGPARLLLEATFRVVSSSCTPSFFFPKIFFFGLFLQFLVSATRSHLSRLKALVNMVNDPKCRRDGSGHTYHRQDQKESLSDIAFCLHRLAAIACGSPSLLPTYEVHSPVSCTASICSRAIIPGKSIFISWKASVQQYIEGLLAGSVMKGVWG